MKRLVRRFPLWRWDCSHGGTLALAERRLTVLLGHGQYSERLSKIIADLRSARVKL